MKDNSLGFIGSGRIVSIFLTALERRQVLPENISVHDPDRETLDRLRKRFPNIQTDGMAETAGQDWVFLAVHPPVMKAVLTEMSGRVRENTTVISLAPKWTIQALSELLGKHRRIVRMIPNAPSIINEGYNPVAFPPDFPATEKESLLAFFEVFGSCPEVPETDLEAYAIITAMGPTYLWFQFDELTQLFRSFGLSEEKSAEGMENMIQGVVKTLYHSGLTYEEVTDLIPVKPLQDAEEQIRSIYREKLNALYAKLKG